MDRQIVVRLKRSLSGRPPGQRKVAAGLGLRKMWREVRLKDTPEVRGMISKISHLVEIVRTEEQRAGVEPGN